jgi:ABC-type microcin C transport system permease subunit YejE
MKPARSIPFIRVLSKFLLKVLAGLFWAALGAILGIIIGSICGVFVAQVLWIVLLPFDNGNNFINLMKGSIFVCQIIAGVIGLIGGFVKPWQNSY